MSSLRSDFKVVLVSHAAPQARGDHLEDKIKYSLVNEGVFYQSGALKVELVMKN